MGWITDVDVPMVARDGTRLLADVHQPTRNGRRPTLLMRTPYLKTDHRSGAPPPEVEYFVPRGYNVVVQDVRGRGASGGNYVPWVNEACDGNDAVRWAAGLPCSNGRVGTLGQSYPGSAQYLLAPTRPAGLEAMVPTSGPVSFFKQRVFRRGVLELGWVMSYVIGMSRATLAREGRYRDERQQLDDLVVDPRSPGGPLTDDAYRTVPIQSLVDKLSGVAPYLRDLLAHDVDGPFWWETEVPRRANSIDVPMLHVGGWYDAFLFDTLTMYEAVHAGGATERTRRHQRLLVGPWGHLPRFTTPSSGGAGDIDFGDEAKIELFDIQRCWFDHFLRDVPNAVDEAPPVRLFVMGINRWRDEDQWPLSDATPRALYLHSNGDADRTAGSGSASWEAPGDEPHDRYVFDPDHPVPTTGGPIVGESGGVADQREIERRPDVLVYTSQILTDALEVTGRVSANLWVSTSGRDTDFTVKLIDVHPDGFAQNIVEGVVRARFRDSLMHPTLLEPNVVYQLPVDLDATSHVVLAGHRLRIDISSSNFPRFDRNPNTGARPIDATVLEPATQRVFHDAGRPSHVVLPVLSPR